MKKKKKKQVRVIPNVPVEWIYEADKDSLEEIYNILLKEDCFRAEYWPELGIMEVVLSDGHSLDFEESEDKGVYWVDISPFGYDVAVESMKKIEELCGGKFSHE